MIARKSIMRLSQPETACANRKRMCLSSVRGEVLVHFLGKILDPARDGVRRHLAQAADRRNRHCLTQLVDEIERGPGCGFLAEHFRYYINKLLGTGTAR